MSKFQKFYFGERSKADNYQIIESVKKSKAYNKSGNESTSDAKALLLWDAKYQNSWLVRTNERIYKMLDDIRKDRPIINWSRKIERFKDDDIVFAIDYKLNTGKIKFKHKPHKEYRYSKKLFSNYNKDIKSIITSFIKTGDFYPLR